MLAAMDAMPVSKVVSPEELDKIILDAHALGNDVRRKLIMALLAMEEGRLYLPLGFSSTVNYAERRIRCGRSLTYELLRVAKVLRELTDLDCMFRLGVLNWSDVKEIAKVATAETQGEWIAFAREKSVAQLEAEVRDAVKKGRKTPRRDGYGLPRVTTRIGFELEPEEHDLVAKALGKAREEMGRSLGEAPVELKDALLHVARQFLESDPVAGLGRVEREDSLYTILYHRCPECRKAHLPTPEGPVEIPAEVVDAVESEAKKVMITPKEESAAGVGVVVGTPVPFEQRDHPNTPSIVKKVLLRDGQVCANPMCGAKLGLHAHHIQFRINGGKTTLANETAICPTCHSLAHAGLLRIEGNPLTGLVWKPKCAESDFAFGEALMRAGLIAEVRVAPTYENVTIGHRASTRLDDSGGELDAVLVRALVKVGYGKTDAVARMAAARDALAAQGLAPNAQNLLTAALRAA
jgi:hypothetical protein